MATIKVPDHLAEIRNAAITHALERGSLPANIEELYHWLFWESGNIGQDDFQLFLPLSRLNLSDDALRWNLELEDNAPIDDTMRLRFFRERMAQDDEDLVSAHEIKIEREDGYSTLACCTVEMMGQGGPHPTWHGFFSTRDEFWRYLREAGYIYYADDQNSSIDEVKILESWHRG